MFRSARFKLTLFYLVVVLGLSLTLSLSTRWLAQREYEHSNVAQRGAFRGAITRLYGLPQRAPDDDDIFGFQRQQQDQVRARLNEYVVWINIGAFIVGGFGSYWFAGRTLKPIEEAHEAQKRFASDASHELRTPLTAIKTENEVFLRQREFTKDEAKQLIESNLEEVNRLERLASNLLQLTQYESVEDVPLVSVDAQELVSEAVNQLKKVHPAVAVTSRLASGSVLAHRESLVQLLSILLDNAAKYGGGQVIELGGVSHEKVYQLYVRDHGPGIAEADMPHIFERLYRGDKSRTASTPGHGLGLALAQQIATVNRSSLTAANHPEGGAVFTITLHAA